MNRTELLQALLTLRENGPCIALVGICGNVPKAHYELMKQCFVELGLNAEYPVPPPEGSEHNAEHWFEASDGWTMWSRTHPYGAARWALLDRLIVHCGGVA